MNNGQYQQIIFATNSSFVYYSDNPSQNTENEKFCCVCRNLITFIFASFSQQQTENNL